MKVKAVIFDLNGTVLSDEDEYGRAFNKVLCSLGKRIGKRYPHVGGIGVRENWPILLAKYKIKTKKTVDELASLTQKAYLDQISEITFKKGFEKFVKDIRSSGILTALATSNTWWVTERLFDQLGFKDYFDTVTTREEVNFSKPAPDIFRITAEKLNVESSACLVIEDSAAGIEAAHEAGMKAVGIYRNKEHAKTLKAAGLIVRNFSELSSQKITSL